MHTSSMRFATCLALAALASLTATPRHAAAQSVDSVSVIAAVWQQAMPEGLRQSRTARLVVKDMVGRGSATYSERTLSALRVRGIEAMPLVTEAGQDTIVMTIDSWQATPVGEQLLRVSTAWSRVNARCLYQSGNIATYRVACPGGICRAVLDGGVLHGDSVCRRRNPA